jgi:hypothetical protein
MPMSIPSPGRTAPDTPLYLGAVAALAPPAETMTASGLRGEAARGHLVIERQRIRWDRKGGHP